MGNLPILVLRMATIKFLIKSEKNPATIYVRVRQGRLVDVYCSTKYVIDPKDWNPKGKVRHTKNESLKSLNSKLDSLSAKITSSLNETNENEIIDYQFIKNIITPQISVPVGKNHEIIPNEVVGYFDYYIKFMRSRIPFGDATEGTAKKYKVIRGLLNNMETDLKTTYLIADIGPGFISEFENYLLSKGYSNNTIGRAIKFIKTICRHAKTNDIKTHLRLDELKGRTEKSNTIFLTFEELDIIAKKKFSFDYLENARDWLLISCYTGQRVSDFMRFSKEMIRKENGKTLIEFTQVKTDKIMTIPLHSKVIEILEKRKGEFPRPISDQKYNLYIKEVCKLAKIENIVFGAKMNPETNRKETGNYKKWELVSSHIGRRSFASNFYGTIPTSLLIHATGHSTEKMFLEYIGKTDTQKAMQLANYF